MGEFVGGSNLHHPVEHACAEQAVDLVVGEEEGWFGVVEGGGEQVLGVVLAVGGGDGGGFGGSGVGFEGVDGEGLVEFGVA